MALIGTLVALPLAAAGIGIAVLQDANKRNIHADSSHKFYDNEYESESEEESEDSSCDEDSVESAYESSYDSENDSSSEEEEEQKFQKIQKYVLLLKRVHQTEKMVL